MKKILFCLALIVGVADVHAQLNRYIIQFKNKATTPHSIANPSTYLAQRSVDRRTRYAIAVDSTDLPVTPRYIDSVRLAGNVTILNTSKWLNSVSVFTTDAAALSKIFSFSFVQTVAPIAARQRETGINAPGKVGNSQTSGQKAAEHQNTTADFYNYGNAAAQVQIHNGQFLHNIGLRGQGMIISMLDAGYFNYTGLKAFDSINVNGQVLGTWDFVAREQSVAEDHPHGMQCLSTIAANIPGQFVGTAPKAFFYLFRTEDASSEFPIEEFNWVCAAERADSAGGDVISSSLGYSTFDNAALNHTYADMNGNTTIAARGADMAAKKGILLVNSAGNEGQNGWRYIMTPADADSILAVGAVNRSGQVAGFSSYGPSADGQIKPDVASVGAATTIQTTSNTIGTGNGTSYAAPNMAGLATCLWQGFPEVNNMRIINALRQAGSNYAAPDDRIGYGIPDVKKAFAALLSEFATTTAAATNCNTVINWRSKDADGMRYEIERKTAADTAFKKISELAVTGNSFGTRSYQFVDPLTSLSTGSISYRIRQVIDTAAVSFTVVPLDTVTVSFNTACNNTTQPLLLFPNPAKNTFTLQVNNTAAANALFIRIYDATGRMVHESRETKPAAITVYPVNINYLPKGKYFISVYTQEKLVGTEELIKL